METQTDIDTAQVKGVKGGPSIDLWQYDKQPVTIESAKPIQVPSKFTPLIEGSQTEHQKQWVLKVQSVVLTTVDADGGRIEFRASELFNLVQDEKGNLIGFPQGEQSNLAKFCNDLKIDISQFETLDKLINALIGKQVLVKAYDTEEGGYKKTYLKFRY